MGDMILFFLIAVLLIAGILFAIMILTKKSTRSLNVEKYQTRWLAIESSLQKDQPASYHLAIINADKLVDHALREKGYSGNTMGERMKSANSVWKNPDHIWGAHKIRNRIAHEADVQITFEIAARSLVAYKQALKELGAI